MAMAMAMAMAMVYIVVFALNTNGFHTTMLLFCQVLSSPI